MKSKKNYSIVSVLMLLILVVTMLFGCGKTVSNDDDTRVVVDMAGNEITLPKEVKKVANYSSICEAVVIGLGQAGKLAFTPEASRYEWVELLFADFANVERIPASNVNVEEMVKMDIDVVFARNEWGMETLTNAGLNAFYVNFDTTESSYEAIKLMADVLGVSERGETCVKLIKEYTQLVKDNVSKIDESEKLSAYIVNCRYEDSSHLATYGTDAMASDMIKNANAELMVEKLTLDADKVEITEEALLSENPDVIFVSGLYQEKVYNDLTSGKYAGILKAVDENRVYRVPVGVYDWCSGACETGVATLWFAYTMYPDAFENVDMTEKVINYYEGISGVTLTKEQAEAMLAGKSGSN